MDAKTTQGSKALKIGLGCFGLALASCCCTVGSYGGCGAVRSSAATSAFDDFHAAAQRGDSQAMYQMMSSEYRAALTYARFRVQVNRCGTLRSIEAPRYSETWNAPGADLVNITVRIGAGSSLRARLVDDDGDWRIDEVTQYGGCMITSRAI